MVYHDRKGYVRGGDSIPYVVIVRNVYNMIYQVLVIAWVSANLLTLRYNPRCSFPVTKVPECCAPFQLPIYAWITRRCSPSCDGLLDT